MPQKLFCVVYLLISAVASSAASPLKPGAFFDIGPRGEFAATPSGVVAVQIGPDSALVERIDPAGHRIGATQELKVPFAEIVNAFPLSDGSVWLASVAPDPRRVSSGPVAAAVQQTSLRAGGEGGKTQYLEFDLYDSTGTKLEMHRLIQRTELARRPVEVSADDVFLLTADSEIEAQDIRKGSRVGHFSLTSFGPGILPFSAGPEGALVGIDRRAKKLLIMAPGAKNTRTAALPENASNITADGDFLYLLGRTARNPGIATITRADAAGQVLARWDCALADGFVPSHIRVSGGSAYLVDRFGSGERFDLNSGL